MPRCLFSKESVSKCILEFVSTRSLWYRVYRKLAILSWWDNLGQPDHVPQTTIMYFLL